MVFGGLVASAAFVVSMGLRLAGLPVGPDSPAGPGVALVALAASVRAGIGTAGLVAVALTGSLVALVTSWWMSVRAFEERDL